MSCTFERLKPNKIKIGKMMFLSKRVTLRFHPLLFRLLKNRCHNKQTMPCSTPAQTGIFSSFLGFLFSSFSSYNFSPFRSRRNRLQSQLAGGPENIRQKWNPSSPNFWWHPEKKNTQCTQPYNSSQFELRHCNCANSFCSSALKGVFLRTLPRTNDFVQKRLPALH